MTKTYDNAPDFRLLANIYNSVNKENHQKFTALVIEFTIDTKSENDALVLNGIQPIVAYYLFDLGFVEMGYETAYLPVRLSMHQIEGAN